MSDAQDTQGLPSKQETALADPPICVKIPVVIGQNSCEVMVVTEIPTPSLYEIKDINETVSVTNCLVQTNLVIINVVLHKDINYKQVTDTISYDTNLTAFTGPVVASTTDLPFHCFMDIPGALPGDDCQVESASVIGEKDELINPNSSNSPTTFDSLMEKAVIQVVVKVTRTQQVTVSSLTPSVCPPSP